MKKTAIGFLAMLFLFSCGDNETTTEAEGPAITPVENVNGNLPDTLNSVTLDAPLDSGVSVDSIRR